MKQITFGLIRESKHDTRVALTPQQCRELLDKYPNLQIIVEPAPDRCYSNADYAAAGIVLSQDLSQCDYLFGIKEVKKIHLLPNKTYFFFAHVIKGQDYNMDLLQTILDKNIQLVDYECLKHGNGKRILGFGKFAGIVGAHNGLLDYGKKTGVYTLKPAYQCQDYGDLTKMYQKWNCPPIKLVLTGNGRVAQGARELLKAIDIQEVAPIDFLTREYNKPIFTHLYLRDLYYRNDHDTFNKQDFYTSPDFYHCRFLPYTRVADIMINGIFWKAGIPLFFTKADTQHPDFALQVIADVTCDIDGSIPLTHRDTPIGNSTYGYCPQKDDEVLPYQKDTIDIMAVSNLPNELPRDASVGFGAALMEYIIPSLVTQSFSKAVYQATITQNGMLTEKYAYLQAFLAKK